MAFAFPMPRIFFISSTVQRLNPVSDWYFSSSCRATSIALAPRTPLPSKIAINSGSINAVGPRASSFSRGRSSAGSSLIFKVAGDFTPGSDTELVEHFTESVAQLEERIREGVRGETVQLRLGVTHGFFAGIEGGTKRAVGRLALEQLRDRRRFLGEDQLAIAFALFSRRGTEQHQDWQRHFAFAQIGPERFSDRSLVSGDIKTIVVNLVSGADFAAEAFQGAYRLGFRAIEHGTQFGRGREEGAGFHFYDPQ